MVPIACRFDLFLHLLFCTYSFSVTHSPVTLCPLNQGLEYGGGAYSKPLVRVLEVNPQMNST